MYIIIFTDVPLMRMRITVYGHGRFIPRSLRSAESMHGEHTKQPIAWLHPLADPTLAESYSSLSWFKYQTIICPPYLGSNGFHTICNCFLFVHDLVARIYISIRILGGCDSFILFAFLLGFRQKSWFFDHFHLILHRFWWNFLGISPNILENVEKS